MNRSERDVLLVRLDEHDGSDGFHATLISIVLRALVKALPVEDSFSSEELAAISADDSAPQPDFAAMADSVAISIEQNPGVPIREIIEGGFACRWPKPTPAPVERDALSKGGVTRHPQWAFSAAANVVPCVSCGCAMVVDHAKCDVCRPAPVERDETWWEHRAIEVVRFYEDFEGHYKMTAVVNYLKRTFAAPVAFDVEAFAKSLGDAWGVSGTEQHLFYDRVRAVAKEMGVR